jgi:BolA family transcriptional regulator, general stress-responsive regulator
MSEQVETTVGDRIKAKLQSAFSPESIEIIDESHKHAGHAHVVTRPGTADSSGGTHFHIKMVAEAFRGKSRIDRHRAINDLLAPELEAGVHALAIEVKAPGE